MSFKYNQQIKLCVLINESEKAINLPETLSRANPNTFPSIYRFCAFKTQNIVFQNASMPPSDAIKSKLLYRSIKKLFILNEAKGRIKKFEFF